MDKVLIAEDNPVLLKILKAGLRKYEDKFESITAKDGQEAIDILNENTISLLVTDLQMPRVDGLTLLAHMNEHYPDVPCIVMSAHGTPQVKARIQKDVLNFIEKPFEIEELVEVIIPALEEEEPEGTIKGISIANFLQMIHMEQKTCLFEIETEDGEKGYFYFEDGVLYDAVYGELKGEEAALTIIPMDRVKIRFKNVSKGKKKVVKRIETDLMGLIMDAMRLHDEKLAGHPIEESDEAQPDLDFDDADFDVLDFEEPEEMPDNETAGPVDEASLDFGEPEETPDIEAAEPVVEVMPPPRPSAAAPPSPAYSSPEEPFQQMLMELRNINGYRAAALMDTGGELLAADSIDPQVDLPYLGALFNDIFRSAQKASEKGNWGIAEEMTLTAPGGVLILLTIDNDSHLPLLMTLLGKDGGHALARMTMKKLLPRIVEKL